MGLHELRELLLIEIARYVHEKTKDSNVAQLKNFFDLLGEKFDLTVATLNYDDLIARTGGDWFDGFVEADGKTENPTFDRRAFHRCVRKAPRVLLHLHGSVRLGENNRDGEYIAKYTSAESAIGTFNPMRNVIPLISGANKERLINHYAAPLAHYYHVFAEAATTCRHVLIVGYSDGDEHINTWLLENIWAHQDKGRVVHMDIERKGDGKFIAPGSSYVNHGSPDYCLLYGEETGAFPPNEDRLNMIMEFLMGETDKLSIAYGRAMFAWQNVETNLFKLYHTVRIRAKGLPIDIVDSSQKFYGKGKSFGQKRKLVENYLDKECLRGAIGQTRLDELKGLVEGLKDAADYRNFLAHSPAAVVVDANGAPRLQIIDPFFKRIQDRFECADFAFDVNGCEKLLHRFDGLARRIDQVHEPIRPHFENGILIPLDPLK